jgi:hypothetical protein
MSQIKKLRDELVLLLQQRRNALYNAASYTSLLKVVRSAGKAKLNHLKDELTRDIKNYSLKTFNSNFKLSKSIKLKDEQILRLDSNNIDNYTYYAHIKQIYELQNAYSNGVYQQITRYYVGNRLVDTTTITETDIKKIKEILNHRLRDGSEGDWYVELFINEDPSHRVEIISRVYKKIDNINEEVKYLQTFRDNDTGTCVYDAFIKYFSNVNNVRGQQTLKRLQKKIHLRKAYTYENLNEICEVCNSSLEIVDLINEKNTLINENHLNYFRLQMINSKYNHLDLFVNDFEITGVSDYEYDEIKETSSFYVEKMGTIYTLDKTYKKNDTPFKTIYNEWKTKVNYNKLSMLEDSDEFKFLQNYDYSIHRFNTGFEINDKLYKEKDLKKAYYNYSDSNYNRFYKGVPCGAFISVQCDEKFDYKKLVDRVGFFEIEFQDENLAYFGFTRGSRHILFTSTIDLLIENNIPFKFINACYSKSVHIPFSEDFLQKFHKNGEIYQEGDIKTTPVIRGYCKIHGLMNSENSVDIVIKPLTHDYNYYSILNNTNNIIYSNDTLIKIKKINKMRMSHRHIYLAIHAYCKTHVLEQCLKMKTTDIVGVKVDSIVYRERRAEPYEFSLNFDDKKCNIVKMINHNKGKTDYNDNHFKPLYVEMQNDITFKKPILYTGEYIYKDLFIGGAGGTGKTTSLCSKINPKTCVFTTTCWNLISNTQQYNCIGLSLPKLTGEMNGKPCDKTTLNVIRDIIIDEATMINKSIIDSIKKIYYYANLYVLGDIDEDGTTYQTVIHGNNPIKDFTNFQYVKYTNNFRFDNQLDDKLQVLRSKMKEFKGNIKKLHEYVKVDFQANYKDKNTVVYNDKSIGISSNNDLGEKSMGLTEYFIKKGAEPKYYVKITDLNKKLYKGMRLYEKPTTKNYEMKLFHSIHSYQGQTLKHDEHIIISFDKVFDYNLFYTAFSRARRLDQIIILGELVVVANATGFPRPPNPHTCFADTIMNEKRHVSQEQEEKIIGELVVVANATGFPRPTNPHTCFADTIMKAREYEGRHVSQENVILAKLIDGNKRCDMCRHKKKDCSCSKITDYYSKKN